jgi:thiamine kinase-like enzyme
MIYNDEDVAELKKRAQVLALLTRSDNVTSEQVLLLQSLWEKEARVNARNTPALDHYRSFLESLVKMQEGERMAEQSRHDVMNNELAELRKRNSMLESFVKNRHEVEEVQRLVERAKERRGAAQAQASALTSKILAIEEATNKLVIDLDIGNLVQVSKEEERGSCLIDCL